MLSLLEEGVLEMQLVSERQLIELGATAVNSAKYVDALNDLFNQHDINTPLRIAHFLAQVYHESAKLRLTEENLRYSAKALRQVFGKYYKTAKAAKAHEKKPRLIASRVYANRMGNGDEASGDGWRYRGRGLIQLTGKDNYRALSEFTGRDCVTNPNLVKIELAVACAAYYWTSNRLNRLADLDDVRAVTQAINGGLNGLPDRVALLTKAKQLFAKDARTLMAPEIEAFSATHKVAASALNLRSQPVVKPSTRLMTLAQGTQVCLRDSALVDGWVNIELVSDQKLVEGFVAARFLEPLASQILTTAPEPHVGGEDELPVAHLKENRSNITRARDGGRAYPLGEAGRPRRSAATPAKRADQLWRIVKYLNVEKTSHLRWRPRGQTTYCNIYAYDYCYLAGVYLPRVWWTDAALQRIRSGVQVAPEYGGTVRELNANALHDWYSDFGANFGWQRETDLSTLQAAANSGEVCIVVAKRQDSNRSGHIAAVIPETPNEKAARNSSGLVQRPLQSQAGRQNRQASPGSQAWWLATRYEFFSFWRHT